MITLSIACMAGCTVALGAEVRGSRRVRLAAKVAASAAFVLVGVLALRRGTSPGPAALAHAIVCGLVLGALGDACIAMPGKRWFLVGLVAFLLGHIAYVAGIATVEPWQRWLTDAGWLAALPVGASIVALVMLCTWSPSRRWRSRRSQRDEERRCLP